MDIRRQYQAGLLLYILSSCTRTIYTVYYYYNIYAIALRAIGGRDFSVPVKLRMTKVDQFKLKEIIRNIELESRSKVQAY